MAGCRNEGGGTSGFCDDEKVTFKEFQDLLWNQVVYSAQQTHSNANFADSKRCIEEYKKHENGTWFKALTRHYTNDTNNGLNPCNFDHHTHFALKYYYCVHKAGEKAAILANDKSAISHTEFLAAIKKVKTCMDALAAKQADLTVGHLCG